MKTLFKMALPVAAFVLASAGAVGTKAMDSAKTGEKVLINGWVQNPDENTCLQRTNLDCDTNTGSMCTAAAPSGSGVVQAYNLTPAGKCSIKLFKHP